MRGPYGNQASLGQVPEVEDFMDSNVDSFMNGMAASVRKEGLG